MATLFTHRQHMHKRHTEACSVIERKMMLLILMLDLENKFSLWLKKKKQQITCNLKVTEYSVKTKRSIPSDLRGLQGSEHFCRSSLFCVEVIFTWESVI